MKGQISLFLHVYSDIFLDIFPTTGLLKLFTLPTDIYALSSTLLYWFSSWSHQS
jgi:hypothetical protein